LSLYIVYTITVQETSRMIFTCTQEATRGTVWWKIGIWRLRGLGETVN